MSITEQIKMVRRIKADLQKEFARLDDSPVKVDVNAQIEGLEWTIKTLESVKAQLEAQTYLVSIGA